jgi:hypothetical protein
VTGRDAGMMPSAKGRLARGREMGRGWIQSIRSAPVGVLILAAVLCFVAAGAILGGIYLVFSATAMGWAGWAMLVVAAPVTLYMALHLIRLTPWAWSTMMMALVLLLVSSLARALFSPGIPIAAFGEVLLELIFLYYLSRERVRVAFRRA